MEHLKECELVALYFEIVTTGGAKWQALIHEVEKLVFDEGHIKSVTVAVSPRHTQGAADIKNELYTRVNTLNWTEVYLL